MNRLTHRRKLLVGGCVFTALVLGAVCLGAVPTKAASVDVSIIGECDQALIGSSDFTWIVSNGDLNSVPPLGVGQEVLSGGWQDNYILTGPSQYKSTQTVNNSDIVHFDTVSQVQSTGPSIYEEGMMLNSCGSAAAGVACGVDSYDAEGANFTSTQYCEVVLTRSLFMADEIDYRSVGSISQADIEIPDIFTFTAIGSGNGFGSMNFGARSLAGIGNTTELGYVNSFGKELIANGRFNIGQDVRWTSFSKTFDIQ